MDTLGNRVKLLRLDKDMTQGDLGKIFGVDRSSIASWETGRREPDYETVKKLASFFEVTTDYLLGKTDNPSTPEQKIESALTDDPELAEFWQELSKRDDLQLLFKQVRPLSPASIKKIIRIIKAIEDEEAENINGG